MTAYITKSTYFYSRVKNKFVVAVVIGDFLSVSTG